MGHLITNRTYPATWTLRQVTDDVVNIVKNNGDRYGTDIIRMPTEQVFDTYEEAERYISKVDRGDYDGIAVKYRDYTGVKENARIAELRTKIEEIRKKKAEYTSSHSIKTQKAQFIGCQNCGSKLNKDKLRGEQCPLCHTDLRAESTLERIASFEKRMSEYNAKITEEKKKQKDKAKIVWLVKFEYHV